MSNVYTVAPADVQKRAKKIRGKFHVGLDKAKVRVDLLFVSPQEDDDPDPITQFGAVQAGKTRVIAQRDRGAGRGDAEILLDKRQWDELSAAEQDALLDRQFSFLKVKQDKKGDTVIDGNGRPKLVLRRPNRIFAWFDEVAKRHGAASVEVKEASALVGTQYGQLYFPGMSPGKAASNVVRMPRPEAGQQAAAK